jgi:hypothetical protein
LEDLLLPSSIVPKNIYDDLWLEIYFLELIHDEVIDMCCSLILLTIWDCKVRITPQLIQVVREHPKYSFKKEEIVVVVTDD